MPGKELPHCVKGGISFLTYLEGIRNLPIFQVIITPLMHYTTLDYMQEKLWTTAW